MAPDKARDGPENLAQYANYERSLQPVYRVEKSRTFYRRRERRRVDAVGFSGTFAQAGPSAALIA